MELAGPIQTLMQQQPLLPCFLHTRGYTRHYFIKCIDDFLYSSWERSGVATTTLLEDWLRRTTQDSKIVVIVSKTQ